MPHLTMISTFLSLCLGAGLATGLVKRVTSGGPPPRRPAPLPAWGRRADSALQPPPGVLEAERVLRTAPQIKWLGLLLLACLALSLLQLLQAPVALPAGNLLALTTTSLLGLLLWQSRSAHRWELRYDAVGLSLKAGPRGPAEGQFWRDLVAIGRKDLLSLTLHFADGQVMRIPRHIEGCAELLQIADHWIASAQGAAPNARTARG